MSVPASGATAPVITLIMVLLPAPFSPTSACTSPAWRSNDTPCKARTPSYDLLTDPALRRSRGSVDTVARCYRRAPLDPGRRAHRSGSDLGLTPLHAAQPDLRRKFVIFRSVSTPTGIVPRFGPRQR